MGLGGGEAGSAGAKAPAQSGELKLFSLQIQEVPSQVLTHNNSEQGEGTAAISVPGELPPRITLPYSSAPPFALAS